MKTHANTVGIIEHVLKKDIYIIRNRINDKVYIGQSKDAAARFASHCKKQRNTSSLLDKAIQEYGAENFWFEILETQTENYNEREKYWIQYYQSVAPNGYNIQSGGDKPPVYYSIDHPSSAFDSLDNVKEVKRLLRDTSLSLSDIAAQFGVSKRTVLRINQGLHYEEVGETYPIRKEPRPNGKLSDAQVAAIIEILRFTYRQYEDIAAQFGISLSAVKQINSGDCHPLSGVSYPVRRYKNSGRPVCTYAQTTEIGELLSNSDMSCAEIADAFKVDIQTVYLINSGKSKRYRRESLSYPLRKLRTCNDPVSTIPAKGSTPAIDTSAERGAPRI